MDLWTTRAESLAYLHEKQPSKLSVVQRGFDLLDDLIVAFDTCEPGSPYCKFCAITIVKAKNYAHAVFSVALDGHAQEGGALLRPMIEYCELLTFFAEDPTRVELALSGALPSAGMSLSGILCAGHSMTKRSMYANQQEDDEGGHGRSGGDAVDPQGTH